MTKRINQKHNDGLKVTNNVQNKHKEQDVENQQLVFSFKKFKFKPIHLDRKFNNHYKDERQFVDKVSELLGMALPLLSSETVTIFKQEPQKAKKLHLHKVVKKRDIIEEILRSYDFTDDEIDNIFEGQEVYQLEVPYTNGATRVIFEKIDNKISFLFMDPNHHVYFNESLDEAQRALFYEYCPVNEKKQCEIMNYQYTCFAFEFLDENKYMATWKNKYDPCEKVDK